LKHLRYIDALAQHGHFRRAAEACAISQPAMSLQIKELEAILGASLVERSSRQVRLTPLGENFVRRAQSILLAVDDLENLVRASAGPPTGVLRLGIIPTVAPYLLANIIKGLSTHYPDLDVQPREAVTPSLIESVLQSHLDFAVVALPVSEPGLQEFALFQEDFVLVRQAGDAKKPVPDPGMLKEMRLLLLEEGHCFRDQALSFCNLTPSRARPMMEGSSLTTLVQMVGSGMGVTLIPEMAIPLETRSADVSIARFPTPKPNRTIGLVWRKTNPLRDQLMTIGAIVRSIAQRQREDLFQDT
ncbi:MAG: hydrogen peroxide-inducible genes activator, partial [Pseudomonadota bacterium]